MATTKRKTTPAPRREPRIELTSKAVTVIGDIRQTIDADLARALNVAAHDYNAALHAAIKAGLDVKAFFEHIVNPASNDNGNASQGGPAEPVTPPAIKLVSIDRKHLGARQQFG
jgi:hypothetical protein